MCIDQHIMCRWIFKGTINLIKFSNFFAFLRTILQILKIWWMSLRISVDIRKKKSKINLIFPSKAIQNVFFLLFAWFVEQGVPACLMYLDFFSISAQVHSWMPRAALKLTPPLISSVSPFFCLSVWVLDTKWWHKHLQLTVCNNTYTSCSYTGCLFRWRPWLYHQ